MWKVNPKIFVAFWVFMMTVAVPAAEGKLITVDDDAPANFTSIQPAINYASKGDLIEVRPGTYYEAINFIGKAVRLYSRDGSAVTTIDANGAYHAVQCVSGEDANTVLEGFTITGGNADGNWPHNYGGGMYNQLSSPMVTNCIFTGNSANIHGGGMYNVESSPTVINCAFYDNIAADGVGMCNLDNSSPTLTNCIFSNNTADTEGGGMYNWHYSSPTLTNCIFSNNTAEWWGGGMYNSDNSNPMVTNCSLIGNTADMAGGGMYNESSSPTVTNCAFSDNSVGFGIGDGGGMYNRDSSNPTVANCIFWKNVAMWGGGICNYINSSPTLTNCTFSNNICSNGGGGIFNSDNSSPTVTNCILWGNAVFQIMDWDSPASTTTVSFSDVQGGWPGGVAVIDSDPCFVDAAGGDLRLSSSASPCVDSGAISTPGLPATDLAGNPRVVDGDRNGTSIVDMGAYEYQSWLVHNITQDNWYETIQFAIDASVTGDEIEVSPGTYNEAIDFIGTAIRVYSSGGPDVTTIDATGLNSSVVTCNSGEDANTILEGFTITGGNADSGGGMYNNSSSPTVTNCNFTTNSVTGDGGGMYNDTSSPMVTDCTFNGNSAGNAGGGMHNHQSNPTATNCTFEDNEADAGGGMANYTESSPTLTNCTFRDNSARAAGGMNNYVNSSPTLTNCIFTGNIANDDTGGMHNHSGSNAILTNCIFICNSAGNAGGGLQNAYSTTTLTNCTFIGNSTSYQLHIGGGGMHNDDSNTIVTGCTFRKNFSAYGGGMYNQEDSNPIVTNCLFVENEGDGAGMFSWDSNPRLMNCTFSCNWCMGNYVISGFNSSYSLTNCIVWGDLHGYGLRGPAVVTYSNIQGGWSGEGNIDANPCFVEPGVWADPCNTPGDYMDDIWVDGDYHLRSQSGRWDANSGSWLLDNITSPCIDAGNPGCPVGAEPGPNGNRRNMGAYGGTAEASKTPVNWRSVADFTNDWIVDYNDLKIFADYWLARGECIASDLDRNESADFNDLALFGNQWSEVCISGRNITYEIGECIPVESSSSGTEDGDEMRFSVTIEGPYIYFEDMMRANYCTTDLDLQMAIEGDLIMLHELAHTMYVCESICDHAVTARLGPFEAGTYTVAVYQNYAFIGGTVVTIDPAD